MTEFSRRSILKISGGLAGLQFCSHALAIPPADFPLAEVASGVFVHRGRHALFSPENRGDISNAGFVVGGTAVAIIDTGGSPAVGRMLLDAVRATTDLPIHYVINTHMHPDHVFGNAAFSKAAASFIGHHKLGRALAARSAHYLSVNRSLLGDEAFDGTRIIPPDRSIAERTELDLGGRILVLEPQPTAHTDNDLTVLDTETGTLFLGDLLFAEHIPTLDGSIRGWLKVLDGLSTYDVARVVPGHGPATMPWPGALEPQARYLSALATDIRALVRDGKTLEQAVETAGQSEKDAWLLFEQYHARNVTAAFAELEWE